jgi:hypothetical protein
MIKCIIYCVFGLGMFASPGCYSGHGVIEPHTVVYTHQRPQHVYRRYRPLRRYKQRVIYYGEQRPLIKYYYKHKRKYKKRNIYNRTIINRHYYRNDKHAGNKNRKRNQPRQKRGKGKKGKKNKY